MLLTSHVGTVHTLHQNAQTFLNFRDKCYSCTGCMLVSAFWLFSPRQSLVLWKTVKETGRRDTLDRPAEADLQAENSTYRSVKRKIFKGLIHTK